MSADAMTPEAALQGKAAIEIDHAGQLASLPFHAEEGVGQLRDESVGRFALQPAPSEFALVTKDGRELGDHLTLAEAGLEPGDRLRLVRKMIELICNGREKTFEFRADELVSKLRQEGLVAFHIVNSPHLYALFSEAGQELNDNVTLRQAGVTPGSKLVLRQSHVRGGSR